MFQLIKFPSFLKFFFLTFVLTGFFVIRLSAADTKSIAVVGFINLGEKADDNVNLVISKSLITFLSRIHDIDIVPFSNVEKIAKQNNFWSSKSLDINDAADIGLLLKAKEIVTGDYTVNNKNNTVVFNIQIYDPVTSTLIMKRQLKGSGGADIFDTIDKMIRSTSSLLVGRNLILGKLKVDVEPEGSFKLYVNGRMQKEIDKKNGFLDNVVANENMEVSIRTADSGKEKEVYRDFITVKENEVYKVNYVTNMALPALIPSPAGKTLFSGSLYPSEGLFAYFPFISNTLDVSGNKNDAVASKVMLTNDRFGNPNSAYYFKGDYLNKIEMSKAVNSMKNFSFLIWLKNDPDSKGEIIGIKSSFDNMDSCSTYISTSGEIYFGHYNNILQTHKRLLDNKWHFIGCVEGGGIMKIFLDEKMVGEQASTSPPMTILKIGNGVGHNISPQKTGNDYKGTIDDVWIYTNALTEEDISNIYENTKP